MTLTKRCFFGSCTSTTQAFRFDLLSNRPVYVFVEKWVLTSATFQRENNSVHSGSITQRNGDISQPAQVANTTNGRPSVTFKTTLRSS